MKFLSYLSLFLLSGLLISNSGCSDDAPKPNDLAEYGYKGKVREVVSKRYFEFIEKDGKLVYDEAKVGSIFTMKFDEEGNLLETLTEYPNDPEMSETVYYQYEDGRKSGFYAVNPANDTVQRARYTWKNDREYSYTSDFFTGRYVKASSKLNEDYRDVSGSYTFASKDSIYYSNSYENTVIEDNLIKETLSTNEITGDQTKWVIKYSDFDSKGNPQKIEQFDGVSNEPKNVSVREFKYY